MENNMLEDTLLSKCHIFLWNNYPHLRYATWHIANERQTTARNGAVLKAKGVLSGVPDYVINYKGKTLYIEFKSEKGTVSENQKKVHEALRKQGFEVYIVRTFEQFNNILITLI